MESVERLYKCHIRPTLITLLSYVNNALVFYLVISYLTGGDFEIVKKDVLRKSDSIVQEVDLCKSQQ